MKIRTETVPEGEEEIVIRCRERTEKIMLLESLIENAVKSQSEIPLYIGRTEYYISKNEILFFETSDGKVYAHTVTGMYASEYRLFEVENIMPSYFIRISKSAIVNTKRISSLRRELTGSGEIGFKGCDKKVYFSRGYYKFLRDKIEETRLGI
ncbi:MAG: response regulator transcription factor [Clostridia bacterium]|nr:response regulator transcription factor [Clostridia bacterium]